MKRLTQIAPYALAVVAMPLATGWTLMFFGAGAFTAYALNIIAIMLALSVAAWVLGSREPDELEAR